jgi:elongation factor G
VKLAHTEAPMAATSTMQFERYDEVPPNIAEQIVGDRAGEPVPA